MYRKHNNRDRGLCGDYRHHHRHRSNRCCMVVRQVRSILGLSINWTSGLLILQYCNYWQQHFT